MRSPNGPADLPALLDLHTLEELRDAIFPDDDAGLAELLRGFISEGHRILGNLSTGVAQQDADAVYQAAHAMKSSAAALGAMRVSEQARILEAESRSAVWGVLTDKADAIVAAFQETETVIDRYMASHLTLA